MRVCNNHSGIYYRTTIPMTVKNKMWDGKDLKNTHFEHGFLNITFYYWEFRKNAVVSFHQFDLMNASFNCARFDSTIHVDGSDLRCL